MSKQDLIIKFKPTALATDVNVTDHLNNLAGKQVFDNVEQLFPDEKDTDLNSIYVAKVTDDSSINELIDSLNKEEGIDYAHVPSAKKGS